jgi:hypothetical protein
MTSESERLHRVRRTKAQWLAALIQQAEVASPGCFGEAGGVIRRLAAGDDVAPDDLTAALVSLKMTFRDAAALMDWIVPQKPGRP